MKIATLALTAMLAACGHYFPTEPDSEPDTRPAAQKSGAEAAPAPVADGGAVDARAASLTQANAPPREDAGPSGDGGCDYDHDPCACTQICQPF